MAGVGPWSEPGMVWKDKGCDSPPVLCTGGAHMEIEGLGPSVQRGH